MLSQQHNEAGGSLNRETPARGGKQPRQRRDRPALPDGLGPASMSIPGAGARAGEVSDLCSSSGAGENDAQAGERQAQAARYPHGDGPHGASVAVVLVLEPIFEADFTPVSYGFRPRRRAQDAIAEIHALGTRNHHWVFEADIAACFDELDHSAIVEQVRTRIVDKRVLALIKAFV